MIGRVRAWSQVPIVVRSARDREAEKIAALDLGADDFVTKPFGTGELMARLRAALRHRLHQVGEMAAVRIGEIEIDILRRRVTRNDVEVRLSPREFNILALLTRHAGQVVTHTQVLSAVWGGRRTRRIPNICASMWDTFARNSSRIRQSRGLSSQIQVLATGLPNREAWSPRRLERTTVGRGRGAASDPSRTLGRPVYWRPD